MRKLLSVLLPFIGLAVFVFILKGIGVDNIVATFRNVDPRSLLIFPIFTVFILLIRGYRWRMLMEVVGIEYPLHKSVLVWSIGFFGAAVTPGKVGDAVRAYYLSRDSGRRFGECFLTVFVDRLMDVVTMLVTGVVTMMLFSFYFIDLPWVTIVIAVAVIFGLIYLVLHRDFMKKTVGPLVRAMAPEKYRELLGEQVDSFYGSLGLYLKQWKVTLFAYLLTLMFWGGVWLLAYACTVVLGLDIPIWFVYLMMPTVTLVELLPISISGLGTRDATVIYFFSILGLASASAVGFSIMYLVAGTYLTALFGFVVWLLRPVHLRGKETTSTPS